jgi:hypothetical protein
MSQRNVVITVVLILLIFVSTGFAADNYQWKLVDTKDDCQVYTSTVAGKDYIAAKTTCLIPAKIEVISVILRDIANYPEWMEDCKATKILKVVDDEREVLIFWFHQHVALLTDRDMVLKSRTVLASWEKVNGKNDKNLLFADSTNEIPYDSGKGYVRMPSFSSLFELEWVDREHTRVTFTVNPDLGKGIPSGIANITIKSIPYKSLKKMMKIAKTDEYINMAKTSKYNKAAEDYVKAGHK